MLPLRSVPGNSDLLVSRPPGFRHQPVAGCRRAACLRTVARLWAVDHRRTELHFRAVAHCRAGRWLRIRALPAPLPGPLPEWLTAGLLRRRCLRRIGSLSPEARRRTRHRRWIQHGRPSRPDADEWLRPVRTHRCGRNRVGSQSRTRPPPAAVRTGGRSIPESHGGLGMADVCRDSGGLRASVTLLLVQKRSTGVECCVRGVPSRRSDSRDRSRIDPGPDREPEQAALPARYQPAGGGWFRLGRLRMLCGAAVARRLQP